MTAKHDIGAIASRFDIPGDFLSAVPYGSGHINDTYCAVFNNAGRTTRYILQRINHHIFKDPIAVMENIQRVTAFLAAQIAGQADSERRVLTLIPARHGAASYVEAGGNFWRAYRFIENARSFDAVESPAQAWQAGKAFGQFQHLLAGLPAPPLHETIPGFHHTPKRFSALEEAIASDAVHRVRSTLPEIEFALARKPITAVLVDANLPQRVTHNDTKFSNLLLDNVTGEALCVIDLDTVMPGLALYDFGDMLRTATSPAKEDELDLSKVEMQFPLFEALLRGYLSPAGSFLTTAERELLVFSGKLITFEMGIRFLTDYLAGDTYYKVSRAAHNLDRCRTQFKLVESIEHQEAEMNRLVASLDNPSLRQS